ncbi:hypothetical protein WJX84_010680 [Apatococcus fuscideae]|uniref:DNA-directed RNA polymerase III subunit n=1 Tax=Apatococcus fuscideae TaxID=2026836 RepID=A0AAW1TEZ4_9CHLO
MAGRGRGGFRGRGRGGPGFPLAKDDEGNVLSTQIEGPPPLYPELVELPDRPAITSRDERLLRKHRALASFYKKSPYYLKRNSDSGPGTGGVTAEIDRLSGISKKRREGPSLQLSDVMTLHPKYFPPELYNGKQRRTGGSSAKQQQFWASQQADKGKDDQDMNERLAKLEKQETAASKTDKDGKAPGGGEKGEDEDNEEKRAALEDEVFEEDDEDGYGHDDDDYLQGQDYDDDEGYDVDEGGGDDAFY